MGLVVVAYVWMVAGVQSKGGVLAHFPVVSARFWNCLGVPVCAIPPSILQVRIAHCFVVVVAYVWAIIRVQSDRSVPADIPSRGT